MPRRTDRPAVAAPEIVRLATAVPGPVRLVVPRPPTPPAKWTLPAILLHLALAGVLILLGHKALAPAGEDTTVVTVAFVPAGQGQADTDGQTQQPAREPPAEAPPAIAQVASKPDLVATPEADNEPPAAPSDTSEAAVPPMTTATIATTVAEPADEPLPLPPPPPPRVTAPSPPRPKAVPAPVRTQQASRAAVSSPSASASRTRADAAPAAPGGAAAAAPAGSTPAAAADGDWAKGVVTWLQAHRTYPPEAQRRGEQGAAVVRLTVARDGRVRTFTLMQGTGSPRLDAAVEALLSHAELPPFPASMPQPEATIQIPIRYQLTS